MSYKKMLFISLLLLMSLNSVKAKEFTGDKRLSCEALLCLVAGWGEKECHKSIGRYFSIWSWSFSGLIKKRLNFLSMCPSEMPKKDISLIANYSGKCHSPRFEYYYSGMGSTALLKDYGDSEDVLVSCHWDDSGGVWKHGAEIFGYYETCSGYSGSLTQNRKAATAQCTPYWENFGTKK